MKKQIVTRTMALLIALFAAAGVFCHAPLPQATETDCNGIRVTWEVTGVENFKEWPEISRECDVSYRGQCPFGSSISVRFEIALEAGYEYQAGVSQSRYVNGGLVSVNPVEQNARCSGSNPDKICASGKIQLSATYTNAGAFPPDGGSRGMIVFAVNRFSATDLKSSSITIYADDVKPFAVITDSVVPKPAATNVDWEEPGITIPFTEAVDPGTVSDQTVIIKYIKLKDGEPGNCSASGTTITCSPAFTSSGWTIQVTVRGGKDGVKSETGAQLAQDYTWTFTTMPELTVKIIPVQVIDGMDLVQDKPAVVRVQATWPDYSDVTKVPAKVRLVYDNGAASAEQAEPFTFYKESDQTAPEDYVRRGRSDNFYSVDGGVPIIAAAGAHSIQAIVEPAGQAPDVIPKTFEAQANVTVRDARIFRVNFLPINVGTWGNFDAAGITAYAQGAARVMNRIFPVTMARATMRHDQPFNINAAPAPNNDSGAVGYYLLDILFKLANTNRFGPYDAVVGVVPLDWISNLMGSEGLSSNILPYIRTHAVLAAYGNNANGTPVYPHIPVHEVAHIYLQQNIPQGANDGIHDNPNCAYTGYDLTRERYRYVTRGIAGYQFPLMDEWVSTQPDNVVWISSESYQLLLDLLTPRGWFSNIAAERELVSSGQTLYISGKTTIKSGTETMALDPLYVVDASPPELAGGDYAAELQNSAGKALGSSAFAPDFITLKDGTQAGFFIVRMPWNSEAQKVVIKNKGAVVASVVRSAGTPAVSITSPAAGQTLSGTAAISWTGHDADADMLQYALFYSNDAGAAWEPISQDLTETHYDWDTTSFPNGTSCMLKVVANDGFNTAQVLSGAFTVANSPEVTGVYPSPDDEDVQVDSPINIYFRDAMNSASITASTIQLKDKSGTSVRASVSYDAAANQAILIPESFLAYSSTYTCTVTTGVKDAPGSPLQETYSWSFTTEKESTEPPKETCPAAKMLGENSQPTRQLRQLRDTVLNTTAEGKALIELYYRHAAELTRIITADARLQKKTAAALTQLLPAAQQALEGKKLQFSRADRQTIEELCSRIAQNATPELNKAIEALQRRIKAGTLIGR